MQRYDSIKIFLVIVCVLIVIGLTLFLWIGHVNHKDFNGMDREEGQPFPSPNELVKIQATLYFGADGDTWHTETREIPMPSGRLEEKVSTIIRELIKGPKEGRANPIPEGTRLLSVFTDQDGIVYLDFSEEIYKNHPGGTSGELMTIYTIVNTLMENFNAIKGVKFLIMGKEIETLKGHIDTRYSFTFRKQP